MVLWNKLLLVQAKALPINLTGSEVQGLIDGAPYYAAATIPAKTYTGQKKDVTTFGVKATVVTSADVSEDLVYQVTKAVFENFDDFRNQHPAFGPLEKEKYDFRWFISTITSRCY